MKRTQTLQTLAAGCESALVGAMVGLLLTAFGDVASGSRAGVVTTLVIATALGGRVSGWAGALCGSWCGVVFIGFAMPLGDSTAGVVTTALLCAMLAAWFDWLVTKSFRREEERSTEETFRAYLQPAYCQTPRRSFSRQAAAINHETRMVHTHLYKECLP